jgi:hypothetical protein
VVPYPQTFGRGGVPPPHVWPEGHDPHWRTLPQPSLAIPQSKPCSVQVFGVQITPHTPPMHVSLPGHEPQLMMLPQPSPCMPHLKPRSAHVFGTQPTNEQTLGNPAPQTCPDGHEPQSMTPPQPFEAMPQSNP